MHKFTLIDILEGLLIGSGPHRFSLLTWFVSDRIRKRSQLKSLFSVAHVSNPVGQLKLARTKDR